jgi:hypothetical protein
MGDLAIPVRLETKNAWRALEENPWWVLEASKGI